MLTCAPQSLWSWDFRVSGASSGPAAVTLNFLSEQGGISLGGIEFLVCKHGLFSGHWTLERDGDICADAQKPSAMFRSFEVSCGAMRLMVEAHSAFTRCYDIIADGSVAGTIRPAHPFTRLAYIECSPSVPEFAQLFSFWLAVLTWRRAAHSHHAGS